MMAMTEFLSITSYKRPCAVVLSEEMPRNPIGEVLMRVLREQRKGVETAVDTQEVRRQQPREGQHVF